MAGAQCSLMFDGAQDLMCPASIISIKSKIVYGEREKAKIMIV